VVSDVARVVTNHATGIKHPDLSPVLEVRPAPGEHAGKGTGKPVLLAVAGAVDGGRLLAVGDASLVMNSMLRYAGNKTFARNLLHYVADDDARGVPAGPGKSHVYLVGGDFAQVGSFGDEAPESAWTGRLRALKDMLSSIRTEGFPPALAYFFAVLVGLGVVLWTGSRAGRTHRIVVPRFTRATPLSQQGGVAGHAALVGDPRDARAEERPRRGALRRPGDGREPGSRGARRRAHVAPVDRAGGHRPPQVAPPPDGPVRDVDALAARGG
jgi:hypothetical protein